MKIRSGGAADVPLVLALMDEAVEWVVARGQTEQWGQSRSPGGDLFVAQLESLGFEAGAFGSPSPTRASRLGRSSSAGTSPTSHPPASRSCT